MADPEKQVAEILAKNIESLDTELAEELVKESTNKNFNLPETDFTKVTTSEKKSYSSKLSNIEIEFDLEAAFVAFGQSSSVLSGDPVMIGSSVAILCASLINKSKVNISPAAGLVYALAFKNRHARWEIPKDELFSISKDISRDLEKAPTIRNENFSECIKELDRVGCIDVIKQEGEEYVILRERCTSKWSI